MMGSNSRTGGSLLLSPHQMILAHMTYVLQNGMAAGHKSQYLKNLQAGLGFMLGANQPGKAFMTGFGRVLMPASCTKIRTRWACLRRRALRHSVISLGRRGLLFLILGPAQIATAHYNGLPTM